jgi:hypothetical protein
VRGPEGNVAAEGAHGGTYSGQGYHGGSYSGSNVNVNTANVNVNRNVNVSGSGWGGYYGPGWGGVAAGAAVGAAAGLAIGASIASLPPAATQVVVYGQPYYRASGVYYQPCYVGADVSYCVVDPPQ